MQLRRLRQKGARPDRKSLTDYAMKAEIHPKYHAIKVVMTDGTEFTTRST